MKNYVIITVWITVQLICNKAVAQGGSGDGSNTTTSVTESIATKPRNEETKSVRITDWLPKLNATCDNKVLQLTNNPSCIGGKLTQTRSECQKAFKNDDGERGCVKSQREINCTADQACSPWSNYTLISKCCPDSSCKLRGFFLTKSKGVYKHTRICAAEIGDGCDEVITVGDCVTPRKYPGAVPPSITEKGNKSSQSHHLRTIAFVVAAMVMVGLLLFAVVRIRRVTAKKRIETDRSERRGVEGIENGALTSMPSDSRVQAILNNMNANGQHYELRERSDSTPGRRVYVISPTGAQPSPANRGRVFSRATSQLSSIAEESCEDALSHITEGTEPLEDDRIFKYDSDTINEIEKSDGAFSDDETQAKPASSTEAINCINDVIAMYDVENEMDNELTEMLKRNSVISQTDYRKSSEVNETDLLTGFGWKPDERSWTITRLKDEDSRLNQRRMSTSCSTLNSMYLSNRSLDSVDSGPRDATSDAPLLDDMTSSNLASMKAFSSMPTVLDTSDIPEIEEVLGKEAMHDTHE